MEQAAGKVLLVCCCSVIADNFMALIQEETWMKKGWDLVRDVSTPAFSPGSFTRYSSCSADFKLFEVSFSLILSDEEEVESFCCVGFFSQSVRRFCSTSICHFLNFFLFFLLAIWFIVCAGLSLCLSRSARVCDELCLLCGTSEPDLSNTALCQNLIQTVARLKGLHLSDISSDQGSSQN